MDDNNCDEWDRRYAVSEQMWSGRPNAALVTETTGLPAGSALDVGCGEGADALWLAEHGWAVTGLDLSQVALDRAAAHAEHAGAHVSWVHAGIVEVKLPSASYDLVSVQYPALLRTATYDAETALLDAVAVGGVLLVVGHRTPTEEEAAAHGFHPDTYIGVDDVEARLDSSWRIEVNERRPRHLSSGAGSNHTEDVVLRARRLT